MAASPSTLTGRAMAMMAASGQSWKWLAPRCARFPLVSQVLDHMSPGGGRGAPVVVVVFVVDVRGGFEETVQISASRCRVGRNECRANDQRRKNQGLKIQQQGHRWQIGPNRGPYRALSWLVFHRQSAGLLEKTGQPSPTAKTGSQGIPAVHSNIWARPRQPLKPRRPIARTSPQTSLFLDLASRMPSPDHGLPRAAWGAG